MTKQTRQIVAVSGAVVVVFIALAMKQRSPKAKLYIF